MKNNIKIIDNSNICLFCGKEIETKYEENEAYYECDCEDVKLEKEILEKINRLRTQLPIEKYEIKQTYILIKKEEND